MGRVGIYKFFDEANNTYTFIEEIITPLFDRCFEDNQDIYNLYLDSQKERQKLDELIEDAKAQKFETVIVTSIQEFGKYRKDIRDIVYTLNSYGVNVEELESNKAA